MKENDAFKRAEEKARIDTLRNNNESIPLFFDKLLSPNFEGE